MLRIAICLLLWAGAMVLPAADGVWLTDYAKAVEKAKQEKKHLLVDFTGKDWCITCKQIKKEVFDHAEFVKFAKDHLVLVELDFPIEKPLPESEARVNKELSELHKVEAYPTVLLLGADEKELLRITTYDGEGVGPVVAKLKQALPKQKDKK